MGNTNRALSGVLVGAGGATVALALLCCIAPWLLAGFLVALGVGWLLNDVFLVSIAAVGVLVALLGFWLRRKHMKGEKGAA